MLKKHSFVKILPAYSSETRARTIHDEITGHVCRIVKEANAQGFVDVSSTGINAGYTDINIHQDRCVPFDRQSVKVTFEDGDYLETAINGTREAVTNYYLGQWFEGQGVVVKVEFHVDMPDDLPPTEEKPYDWMSDHVKDEQAAEWVRKHT